MGVWITALFGVWLYGVVACLVVMGVLKLFGR
jgi:hypothetical protein